MRKIKCFFEYLPALFWIFFGQFEVVFVVKFFANAVKFIVEVPICSIFSYVFGSGGINYLQA